jgi:hypothetical protein
MSTKNQTSVDYAVTRGREGGIANSNPKFATSNVAEETMKAGRFVKVGTDLNEQVKKIAATGDVALGKLVGVLLHDRGRTMSPLLPDDTGGEGVRDFSAKEEVAVMKEGSVYMAPETAMNHTSTPYIRHAGKKQVQTLEFSAALITGNKINGDVGGNSITEVVFATSNVATLTAIAAAILAANDNVLSAVSDGIDTITVTTVQDADDQDLTNWVVTEGASQATTTVTETVTAINTSNIGKIRGDADGGTATIAPTGTVRVLEKAAANDIVPVSINLN